MDGDELLRWIDATTHNPPKKTRVLVCGGQRNVTNGFADVQCAYIDGSSNVWLDDREIGGGSANDITGWAHLPKSFSPFFDDKNGQH